MRTFVTERTKGLVDRAGFIGSADRKGWSKKALITIYPRGIEIGASENYSYTHLTIQILFLLLYPEQS